MFLKNSFTFVDPSLAMDGTTSSWNEYGLLNGRLQNPFIDHFKFQNLLDKKLKFESNQMTVKTFQIVQENLKVLGMDSNPSVPKFNAKTLGILFLIGMIFTSNCIFIRNEADRFEEYVLCAYVGSGVFVTAVDFLHFVRKKDKLFTLMNRFECVINESE